MNIGEKLLLIFITGWVAGQIGGATTSETLMFSTIVMLGMGYLFNAHGLIWQKFKDMRNV